MNTPKMRYEVRFNPSKQWLVNSTDQEACFEVVQIPGGASVSTHWFGEYHYSPRKTYPSGHEGAKMAADDKCAEMNAGLAKLGMLEESGTPEPVAPPAPKFKRGDKVRHRNDGQRGTVIAATENPPFECAVDWRDDVGGVYVESALELDDTPAASPEPKAGQVWVSDAYRTAYILHRNCYYWQPIELNGLGSWRGLKFDNPQDAVCGLTLAAPTVADYYQRELLARVAELEALCGEKFSHNRVLELLKTITRNHAAIWDAREGELMTYMRAEIEADRTKAREQGAKQAREERFVALHWEPTRGLIYDNKKMAWRGGGGRQPLDDARAEAARLDQLDQQEPSEAECGVRLIANERTRQVSAEGWDASHDDAHEQGELADAAGNYLFAFSGEDEPCGNWPFENSWWKPSDDRVRNLVKAGALIAAEIDRLRRMKEAANA